MMNLTVERPNLSVVGLLGRQARSELIPQSVE